MTTKSLTGAEFPTHTVCMARHRETTGRLIDWECVCGATGDGHQSHSRHQGEAWRAACAITTVEQLAELACDPTSCDGAVIKTSQFGDICESNNDGTWNELGGHSRIPADQVVLPALLLWHVSWRPQHPEAGTA